MEIDTYKRLEEIGSAISSMRSAREVDYSRENMLRTDLSIANARIQKIEIETLCEIRDALRALSISPTK